MDSRPLYGSVNHLDLMARQGFALQLTSYDPRGWRATFYTTGMEHSPTSATGTALRARIVFGTQLKSVRMRAVSY